MGRPPGSGAKPPGEKFVAYGFRLSPALLEQFRAAVAENRRAEFVREAIEEKMAREEAVCG